MVKIKNIRINGNLVNCEIYPEDSNENGYMVVNIAIGEIVEFNLPSGYEWCINHLHRAKRFIIEQFAEIRDVPIKEKTIMWY